MAAEARPRCEASSCLLTLDEEPINEMNWKSTARRRKNLAEKSIWSFSNSKIELLHYILNPYPYLINYIY